VFCESSYVGLTSRWKEIEENIIINNVYTSCQYKQKLIMWEEIKIIKGKRDTYI